MLILKRNELVQPSSEIKSLRRAIAILRTFTIESPELGLTEISKRVGLQKTTTFRLLQTLKVEGLVNKDPESGRYRLGIGVVELAGIVLAQSDLRRIAQPHMHVLAERFRNTVTLSVLIDDEPITIDQVVPSGQLVSNYGWIGRRNPFHATSVGKVLLAWQISDQIEKIANSDLETFTPRTITDAQTLIEHLEKIRQNGYAIGKEEYEIGLNAVAAPIKDYTNEVKAALAISGPSYRLEEALFEEIAHEVIDTAQAISSELGYKHKNTSLEGFVS